jgi:hypothetical protein
MTPETTILFNVNAYWMIGTVVLIFMGLLAIIWKAKKEISDTIKEELNPFKESLGKLEERMMGHDRDICGLEGKLGLKKYGTIGSPYKLNKEGEKLLEESKFFDLFSKEKARIFSSMEKLGTRTLYDTEKNALVALKQLESDPVLDEMKEFAVNHPNIPLELILTVASWIVRDEYWKSKHPTTPIHE